MYRKALSVGGNLYIKVLLGMPVNDATAGYRVYRSDALRAMGLDDVASQGYCFQIDLTWRAVKAGLTVVEVPITFVEREVGDSKMSRDIMTESLSLITRWGVRHRAHQVRELVGGAREPRWHDRCEPHRRHPVRRAAAGAHGCCAGSSSPCSSCRSSRSRRSSRSAG